MRNVIVSGVKTAVQFGVAAALTWLASLGIEVAGETAQYLEAGLFAVVLGVVTSVLNAAGDRFPIINRIVSLGLTAESAEYT